MRVVLVNPARIQPSQWGKPCVYQPLDLAYVAAVLERRHVVEIFDVAGEGWRCVEGTDGTYRMGFSRGEIERRLKPV